MPAILTLEKVSKRFGAVVVADGAENVREPRLPKEPPPPTRASASPATSVNAVTTAASAINQRWRNMASDLPAEMAG